MRSKICILSTANIKHMTLINLYTRVLDEKEINYDIVYFDRYNIIESIGAQNIYRYTENISHDMKKSTKLKYFLKFRKYAKKILKDNNYDLIIVWNTPTALLFSDFLFHNRSKYILNVRDYFHESNKIIYNLHKVLIKNSLFTTISSKGFESFLPENDYVYVNSINEEIVEKKNNNKNLKQIDFPINIGFLGNIRFYPEQIKLINALQNDERFMLWYCGTNGEPLEKYVKEKGITNCIFTGQFSPDETKDYLEKFDMINNIFGNESIAVRTLTPIRLYHATFFHIPILVNNDTHLEKLITEHNLGLSVDVTKDDVKEKILNYFLNLNIHKFEDTAENFNSKVLKENSAFKSKFETELKKLKIL